MKRRWVPLDALKIVLTQNFYLVLKNTHLNANMIGLMWLIRNLFQMVPSKGTATHVIYKTKSAIVSTK